MTGSRKIPVLLMARALHIGGSERQMTETAKWLDRSVFEPHVGCFRPAGVRGEELRDFGVNVIQWPVMSFRSLNAVTAASGIARYVRDHEIAIVHTWDYPLTVYAIPLARLATRALAVSSQRSERALIPPGYRRLMALTDRFAHAIVVNCHFLERQLTAQGAPPSKIRVCRNGIDLDRFGRCSVEHPFTIGVVCALRPEKNLEVLIDAFAAIRDSAPGLRLLIVGDGPERGKLRARADAAGIAGACRFEPAAADVTPWLSAIDLFVLPSLSEAFSNSLIEAMACGCCVIASDTGGNPELVKQGETGMLFRTRDAAGLAAALRALLADAALRARLAAGGCNFVRRNFTMAESARRMQEIYLGLLEKRPRK